VVYDYGVRNTEGDMLLEFADVMDLVIANTWFKKIDQKLMTFESGECRTTSVRKVDRKLVKTSR